MVEEIQGVDRHKYILPDDVAGPHKALSSSGSRSLASHGDFSSSSNDTSSRPTRDQSPTPTPSLQSPNPEANDDNSHTITDSPYFRSFHLRRVASMSSLSRASFSSQLSQLASLQLPQAASLASTISAMPAASSAARALTDAAEQIRDWIGKAAQVLQDLDAEDDVEWAAAGGREGLGEVDKAVRQFEGLVKVYVGAIEELRARKDLSTVPVEQQKAVVAQMEKALDEWDSVRKALSQVKLQVELAMEWEELLNVVLGDIGLEIEQLAGLVFEMEEKRHRSMMDHMAGDAAEAVDLGELETIAEESTPVTLRRNGANRRATSSIDSPLQSPITSIPHDDSSYLALFARMQPLRASLDFLPMRLASFIARAEKIFPTACEELESRRLNLEDELKEVQKDAEALKKELGEDRWVTVFRNAGCQAQKMCQLVSRSIVKLREAIDAGFHHTNPSSVAKKMESYEAKKTHYGPAIERVLAIIERGVKDRLTVNGEILTLRADAEKQWKSLEEEMKAIDVELEGLSLNNDQQLRDSISTIISLDRSAAGSTVDTPGSSPASSVVMAGSNGGMDPSTPLKHATIRPQGSRTSSIPRRKDDRRHASLPQVSTLSIGAPPRTTTASRLASNPVPTNRNASPSRLGAHPSIASSSSLIGKALPRPSLATEEYKPRWNSSVNTKDSPIGHHFAPTAWTTPSPHRRVLNTQSSSSSIDSKVVHTSPLTRDRSESPLQASPSFRHSVYGTNRVSASPVRPSISNLDAPPRQRLRARVSTSFLPDAPSARPRLSTVQTTGTAGATTTQQTPGRPKVSRPASAMASGRRSSLLPMPKASPTGKIATTTCTTTTTTSGRVTPAGATRDRSSLLTTVLRPSSRSSSRLGTSGRASPAMTRPGDPAKNRPAWR